MPSDVGRALSIQQQYALELVAAQAGDLAAALLESMSTAVDRQEADRLGAQYAVLLAGAMMAVAQTRVGYLQAFAVAEGQPLFDVPAAVLRPTVDDVLLGGASPGLPAPRGVLPPSAPPVQTALRAPSSQGAMWAALTGLSRDLEAGRPDALMLAGQAVRESTESTVIAASDFVDGNLLGPTRSIVAMRRVIHPGACERCQRVAGVLVFKSWPRLRHPQCRCSFEPVYASDPEYQGRLARYQRNAEYNRPGAYGRDRRYRGRQQLARAEQREGEFFQDTWREFLQEEQTRLAAVVKTKPSNTFRDWAVMVSATQAESGGNLLPVITRE